MSTDTDPHVDFVFGTTIDLTDIDISVHNETQAFQFYSVDDSTGNETQITRFWIERIDEQTGDRYHIWRTNEVAMVYEPKEDFDELILVKDDGIPPVEHNEDGSVRYVQKQENNHLVFEDDGVTPVMVPADNSYNQYQRFKLHFFEMPVKHLRVRQNERHGQMFVSECHPYGTVVGAGKTRYRKETLMIFR